MIIKEVHLYTSNLKATKYFYDEIMSFNISGQTNDSFGFKAGDSQVIFHEIENEKPVYHFAFHIPNNKLQEALDWVSERTPVLPFSAETKIADFKNWNARSFYFHDNNQNILELITHYDRKIESGNPLSTKSIEMLIEIGIPSRDVLATCEELSVKYGIDYFTKGPVTNDFAVMGDEKGMLIISKEGGTWLPVNQKVQKFKMKIQVDKNGNIIDLGV